MRITIRYADLRNPLPPNKLRLDVEGMETIGGVKGQIHQLTQIPPSHQSLIFAGKALEDTLTLTACNIYKGCCLTLVTRNLVLSNWERYTITPMTLYIKRRGKQTLPLEVLPFDTVLDVMAKLGWRGVTTRARLVFAGRALEEGATLFACKVREGSTLTLARTLNVFVKHTSLLPKDAAIPLAGVTSTDTMASVMRSLMGQPWPSCMPAKDSILPTHEWRFVVAGKLMDGAQSFEEFNIRAEWCYIQLVQVAKPNFPSPPPPPASSFSSSFIPSPADDGDDSAAAAAASAAAAALQPAPPAAAALQLAPPAALPPTATPSPTAATATATVTATAAAAATASAVSQAFLCSICDDTCVEPATASCGQHNFCLDHLRAWVVEEGGKNKRGGVTCPVCRAPIQQTPGECRVNVGIRDAIEAARANGMFGGGGGGGVAAADALPAAITPSAASLSSGSGGSGTASHQHQHQHQHQQLSRAPLIPYGDLTFEFSKRGRVELGRGAFSTVTAASYLGEPCAVKSLTLSGMGGGASEALLALFWRESTLQYHLRHEGIAALHGVCIDRDEEGGPITELALIMPRYVCSLDRVLYAPSSSSSSSPPCPYSMSERLQWLRQIGGALRFLHARGMVHGDLKPLNVLMSGEGGGGGGGGQHTTQHTQHQVLKAKVCDFGHAFLRPEGAEGSRSMSIGGGLGAGGEGTSRYKDPAVSSGRNALRKASDVYSWGILAWEVLTGEVPFKGMDVAGILAHSIAGGRPPLHSLPPTTPPALVSLIHQCWDPLQANRPTATALCKEAPFLPLLF